MERIKLKITKQNLVVGLITLFFFILPFLWFKPGEMDLGGDSSRLYFYDPIAYLKNYAFYGISPSAFGAENIGYMMVPFVLFLLLLKSIFVTPTLLIAFFHGISLSVAFLACYGIIRELLNTKENKSSAMQHIAAILGGLTYIFSPVSVLGWDKVLVTHNQFFLNPLMFYLFLKYFRTDKTIFLALGLITTFLFSPNFSFVAAPGFFAFYPLALLFLFSYRLFVIKKKIIWQHLFVGLLIFILLQSFHILPQLVSMSSQGSVLNETVFSNEGKFDRGLNYFVAIAPNIKASLNLMSLPQMIDLSVFSYFFVLFPLIIITGFLFNRKKTILLTGIFFLITFFFATANITDIGFAIYKKLFSVPGFSIFRNFYGQWGYMLLFFYTILFGQALAILFEKYRKITLYLITSIVTLVLLFSGYQLLNGSLVNKEIWQSNNIKVFMKMDPQYEAFLHDVKELPVDGKIITLPLTDPGYQIVAGTNNGAYQGPSTISYLAGKQDFAGYEEFGAFKDILTALVKNKQYEEVKKLLGFLNIKYIVYNADPRVYEAGFPTFPYIDIRRNFPQTQKEYKEFLQALSVKQIKNIDNKYFIYEIDKEYQQKIFVSQRGTLFVKKIDDWSLPLSFTNEDMGNLYFDNLQLSLPVNEKLAILDSHNLFTKIIKNPNPPHFLHNAFAKTAPTSLLYKLSVIKEYRDLNKTPDNYLYFDSRMFLSAKLVYAAELWGKNMPLSNKSDSPDAVYQHIIAKEPARSLSWELQNANNDWESFLTRYVRNFLESADYLKKNSSDVTWVDEQKVLMNEYLLNHKQRFNNTLASVQSVEDRAVLTQLIDRLFKYLTEQIGVSDASFTNNEYLVPEVDTKVKSVDLYMKKNDFDAWDQSQFGLEIDNQVLSQSQEQDEPSWIKLTTGTVDFHTPKTIKIVTKTEKNLMDNADVLSLQSTPVNGGVQSFIKNGAVWKVHNLQPNGYYLLSFEYKNSGAPYDLRFYEESVNRVPQTETKELFKNQLNSPVWEKYQAVIRSGNEAEAAVIQLERSIDVNPLSAFETKNMTLRYLPQPTFVLKTTYQQEQTSLPNISFTKINPTKYVVTVTNSKEPYYLFFNQMYSARWKIYQQEAPEQNTNDLDFIKRINADSLYANTHYPANGGMNAWYIDPKSLGDKNSYTFILEFTTQHYFYIGLIISSITFLGLVIYALYLLLTHEK